MASPVLSTEVESILLVKEILETESPGAGRTLEQPGCLSRWSAEGEVSQDHFKLMQEVV